MKTVFFDVDTQLDFLFPAGALYFPGAEEIVGPLIELTRFAAANGIPIVSTMDAHAEDDPEFELWKPHCVAGTAGQKKLAGTLLGNGSQTIVEKQSIDCFTNPNLRPLLDELRAERYVVYGVVTELCVRCAAFGLLETGTEVVIVREAVKSLDDSEGRQVLERFRAEGGKVQSLRSWL